MTSNGQPIPGSTACKLYGQMCINGCQLAKDIEHQRDHGGRLSDAGDVWAEGSWTKYTERSKEFAHDLEQGCDYPEVVDAVADAATEVLRSENRLR